MVRESGDFFGWFMEAKHKMNAKKENSKRVMLLAGGLNLMKSKMCYSYTESIQRQTTSIF